MPKPPSVLKSQDLTDTLARLQLADLYEITTGIRVAANIWFLGSGASRLESIARDFEGLAAVVDFAALEQRTKKRGTPRQAAADKWPSLFVTAPELETLHSAAWDAIRSRRLDPIEKAEAWLTHVAKHPGEDSDWEAAVYLSSRGKELPPAALEVQQDWHRSVCFQVASMCRGNKKLKDVEKNARGYRLSLGQAAEFLRAHGLFEGELPVFWNGRDQEGDFLSAAMLRAADWLNVVGFDDWWNSATEPLSNGPQDGVSVEGATWLFHWCRSDLALRIADSVGVNAWLDAFARLNAPRGRPWDSLMRRDSQAALSGFVLAASSLSFCWARIRARAQRTPVVNEALAKLMSWQLPSGAWPVWSNDTTPSLLSTCLAVHALAVAKPVGWQPACQRAAQWLLTQQDPYGFWSVQGGPTVMLTVLVLDAISLAAGGVATFGRGRRQNQSLPAAAPTPESRVSEYSSEPWHKAEFPQTRECERSALGQLRPADVLVATVTTLELKQVLRLLKPPKGRKYLQQVDDNGATYFVGVLGRHKAAVVRSTMGTSGPTGATLTIDTAIRFWRPKAVIMVGIAFGASREKQAAADILIADRIIPYETQRVGARVVYRDPIPATSSVLRNRFEHAVNWNFFRADGSRVGVQCGPVLSGEKLIDNVAFRAPNKSRVSRAPA